jgi:hypothetical protein
MTEDASDEYPAFLDIDYPDRQLNRLTTFFRPIVVIPIAVVHALLSGPSAHGASDHFWFAAGGILVLPTMLLLVFRRKYPGWWFDWNLELTRFSTRVAAYLMLLRDEYPSTDEEQAVHLTFFYPEAMELNRWLPLVKWFLAIPHYIVLAFLAVGAVCAVIIAWFAILFTGRYPRPLFDFVVAVLRWCLRLSAYAFLLTTDRYPPFRLAA